MSTETDAIKEQAGDQDATVSRRVFLKRAFMLSAGLLAAGAVGDIIGNELNGHDKRSATPKPKHVSGGYGHFSYGRGADGRS